MMGREALIRRLRLLRRRMLIIGGMSGLCVAIAVCVTLWLALAWLDLLWELSPDARIFSNIAAITVGAALLTIILVRWLRLSQHALLARQLDRASSSGGQFIAGYELSAASAMGAQSSELSAGLAALAVNRAVAIANVVPPAQVVRGNALRAPVAALATLVLFLVGIGTLMPRLAETEWLRFIDPRGDHPPYSRVTFTVTPGDAKVLYGSGLDVFVTTEGPPVEQVELILAGAEDDRAEALGMFPQQDGTWRAVLTNITVPGQYFVRAGRSRSARYALEVITVPMLGTVRFRVTPPAYTRHAAYEGALPQAGLVGLPGTEVYVWAKSNRPLSGGILKITGGETPVAVALAPQSPGELEVSGAFTLSTPGKFEVSVQDVSGVSSKDTFSGGITLVPDQRPLVRVIEPAATSLATPEATLPVVLSGEDDYGISRLQLFRSLNDSRALPMDFVVSQPAEPRFAPTQALPLSAYGLNAGDVIKLYARIEDNDPAGAKGSESPVCEVRIISQDDFNRMIRAREGLEVLLSKYRQAERRLESQADERAGLRKQLEGDPTNELSQAARDGLAKLARQLRSDAEANREALRHLLPYDLDAALAERLAKLAEALDAAAQAAEDLASSGSLTREQLEKLLDDMANRLDAEREEFTDETLEPLAHLEAIFPLIEDQSRFVELYQLERDLSQRLASVKGRDGDDDPRLKGRMRDFETEQQRIRIALDQLLGDIESHASRLPDDDERLDELRFGPTICRRRAGLGCRRSDGRCGGRPDGIFRHPRACSRHAGGRYPRAVH